MSCGSRHRTQLLHLTTAGINHFKEKKVNVSYSGEYKTTETKKKLFGEVKSLLKRYKTCGENYKEMTSYILKDLNYAKGDHDKFQKMKIKIDMSNPDYRKDHILKTFCNVKRILDAKCILH